MAGKKAQINFQARHHTLMPTDTFFSLGEYCLALIHRRDYEEAAWQAEGKNVLDLGCNNGFGTSFVAPGAEHILGLDVSARAIEHAREHHAGPSVEFDVFDGMHIPQPDGSFEFVMSLQVIEHIENTDAYLAEIARVLAPGGKAMFTTPNAVVRLDPGMLPWNSFHVHEFTPTELKEKLEHHFPHVELSGMFATEPLYSMQIDSWANTREIARRRSNMFLLAIKILPLPLRGLIRNLRSTLANRGKDVKEPLTGEQMQQYSTADFFYRDSNLDDSLILKAVCSR